MRTVERVFLYFEQCDCGQAFVGSSKMVVLEHATRNGGEKYTMKKKYEKATRLWCCTSLSIVLLLTSYSAFGWLFTNTFCGWGKKSSGIDQKKKLMRVYCNKLFRTSNIEH